MTRSFLRILAMALCIAILSATLSGCSLQQLTFGDKPVEILNAYDVEQTGYLTENAVFLEKPAFSAAQRSQAAAGTPVRITQIAETAEGVWANADNGWVPKSALYIPGEAGQHPGFGVAREEAVFLSAPGVQSYINATVSSGTRFEILEQIEIYGYWWAHTQHGWVAMDSVYLEGTAGQRSCRAMVIDPTALNVCVGPGADHEVIATLQYGDYVDILEQVEYNGSDWGYTGEGWIFMELTEIK